MDGITLAMIIDGVPKIVGLVGVLMLVNAIVAASGYRRGAEDGYRGGAEETPPRIAPALIVLLFGFWLALTPSTMLTMSGLNKSGLSFGEYMQREIPLGENAEWARQTRAAKFSGEDSPEALAEGSEPSQPAKARLESGAVGQESESSAHVETQPKVAPIIEKLASPEEARSVADAKALWEVCLGMTLVLGAAAAAWVAGKPMSWVVMGGLILGLPTFLKVTMETMTPIEAPATLAVNAERTAEPKPLAKAEQPKIVEKAVENPVAAPAPIKIDTLATPEEARAAADRKAIFEVLFGVALALAAGEAAWIAARRRKSAVPSEALPNVQFLDAGRNAAFAESDIFAKTAAFHEAKAPSEQP